MPQFGLKRVGQNIVWLAADRVFRMSVGVVVLGVVARYLGPAQFGILNYAVGLAAIFAAVASLGIEGIVIRELVKAPENSGAILGTALLLRLAGGLGAIGIVSLAGLLTRDGSTIGPLALVVALAFLPQSFEVIDLWFQKNIQSKYTVMAKSVAVLAGAAVKIMLVIMKAPLEWFGAAVAADSVLAAAALVVMYRRQGQDMTTWRPTREIARAILRDSWPLILSGLLVSIYMRIEQVLVMNFLGSQSAGIYYAATRITEVWQFVPVLILSSVYPLLLEKRLRDATGYRRDLQRVFDLLTGLGLAVAVVITIAGPYIIPLLYGARFTDSIPILMTLAWAAPIMYSASVRAQYFLLENFTIYHSAAALIGIAINVTLALFLMARLGARGAALGALAGYFASGYLTSWLFPKLKECAHLQTRAFFLPFRWRSLFDPV